jgi:hypothetical protein
MSSVPETAAQTIPVIQVNHEEVHKHLDHVVRDSGKRPADHVLDSEGNLRGSPAPLEDFPCPNSPLLRRPARALTRRLG